MEGKRFQKKAEDFICEHCSAHVEGSGYTNHCPKCLWSKHVDINPGDRACTCRGMMRPFKIEGTTPKYRIVHECEVCGFIRRNDVQEEDDPDAVIALAQKAAS